MKAKELLKTSLSNLLIVQEKEGINFTIEEAMDLNGAIERVEDLVKTLEAKETVSLADLALADLLINACQ